MQRLYSIFPQGFPGLGLLLLRTAIILQLPSDLASQPSIFRWFMTAVFTLTISLGLFTSVASMSLLALLSAAAFERGSLAIITVCEGLQALTLTLLGPGGYSLDARLFGRRVIELPKP